MRGNLSKSVKMSAATRVVFDLNEEKASRQVGLVWKKTLVIRRERYSCVCMWKQPNVESV